MTSHPKLHLFVPIYFTISSLYFIPLTEAEKDESSYSFRLC
jgi:hypothetical protein